MNESLKLIGKIRNITTYGLLACIVLLYCGVNVGLISNLCCATLYVTSFLANRIQTKKTNWLLLISCVLAVFFLGLNYFFKVPFGRSIGLFFIYFYLNLSSKIKTGKWNKWFILLGVVAVSCSIINVLVKSGWVTIVSLVLQIIVIIKFLDPLLEKIALEHREKRLAAEREQNKDQGE